MFSNIVNKIRTKEEVYQLMSEIDILLTSLYESGDKGFDSTLKSGVRSWVSEFVAHEIGRKKKSTEAYLTSLKEELTKLESVNLTLSFEPSDQTIGKFSSQLRDMTGRDVVLDIDIDKKILGGAIISYHGHYKDLSIARLLNDSEAEIDEEIKKSLNL